MAKSSKARAKRARKSSATPVKPSRSLTVGAGVEPEIQTVIYVHGIGNKPIEPTLKCQWDRALFGVSLGDRSRMAYWVNREYYPTPLDETCAAGDVVKVDDDEMSTKSVRAIAGKGESSSPQVIADEIESLAHNKSERDSLQKIAQHMLRSASAEQGAKTAASVRAKVLPIKFLRSVVTPALTRAFLRDVHDFLFVPTRREAMEKSLGDRLASGGGPFLVIAHSQGSMVAYNVLRKLKPSDAQVKLFITIGSPLGLDEVQDVLKGWTALTIPDCVERWINVAERLDPVAADSDFSDDFKGKKIENHAALFLNPDSWRHPHSGTGYLKTKPVQDAVRALAGNALGQAVGQSVIAKDLVDKIESGRAGDRHYTLIQLTRPDRPGAETDLAKTSEKIRREIEKMVAAAGGSVDEAEIDELKRFIAARLTRNEIERLRSRFSELAIERVWKDAAKRALIYKSTHTVQARPANAGYAATGKDIRWAVLDTGICGDHPHFQEFENIERQWDCTKRGPAVEQAGNVALDGNGHGTHVAGAIAGSLKVPLKSGAVSEQFDGMAPQTKLYGFKVLDDRGNGQDSYIIKALDLIAELNEKAGKLFVHGVNLSLGGNFDPSVYGCGHTPLCQELRRLWGQGVLVVLAAGNEGYALLQAAEGELPSNMDLTIGDPANLDEAIAVGSIHKSNPHTYGVSFFSSRGPTADGRKKPDLVAPGEQILSAYHDYKKKRGRSAAELYIEMSGTSMAAPHVSGVLAAFLSIRREFIGYPDRVKDLLLKNCTNLNRDAYIQGAGMPNLIKMLANS